MRANLNPVFMHETLKPRALKAATAVIDALLNVDGIKTATKYISKTLTVRGTWIGDAEDDRRTLSLSIGRPNYRESEFIKDCVKSGEPFPVRKVQFKFPPVKRGQ